MEFLTINYWGCPPYIVVSKQQCVHHQAKLKIFRHPFNFFQSRVIDGYSGDTHVDIGEIYRTSADSLQTLDTSKPVVNCQSSDDHLEITCWATPDFGASITQSPNLTQWCLQKKQKYWSAKMKVYAHIVWWCFISHEWWYSINGGKLKIGICREML